MEGISTYFDSLPFPLTKGQKNALLAVEEGGHTVICGKGGVGKSALLQILKDYYKDEIIFCGSTGAANANLFNFKGGVGTAARVFSLPRHQALPTDWKNPSRYTNTIFAKNDRVKRVVIDEGFMLNSEQLALILNWIKRFNKKTKRREKRDIQLIIVGDAGQLPPVIKDSTYYRREYGHELFFLSNVFKEANFKVCLLNEVVRQSDKVYKAALDVIRYGQVDRYDGVIDWFNRRHIPAPEDAVVICPTNKQVDYYNLKAFNRNPNECFCYGASVKDDYSLNDSPVPLELDLKRGLKVVSIVNDPSGDNRYVNGTQMEVLDCTSEGVWCKILRTGEDVFITPYTFEEQEVYVASTLIDEKGNEVVITDIRIKGSLESIPIKPSASLSGHRCQGITIDYPVLVDMGSKYPFTNMDFGQQLLYVILSRPTSIENLYLKNPLDKDFIKNCTDTLKWLNKIETIYG